MGYTFRMKNLRYLCQRYKGRTRDHRPAWIRWWPYAYKMYPSASPHPTLYSSCLIPQRQKKVRNAFPTQRRHQSRKATVEGHPQFTSVEACYTSVIWLIVTQGTSVSPTTITQISQPDSPEDNFMVIPRVSCYNSEGKPRMLDLFSGTVLTATAFKIQNVQKHSKRGYEVITVDFDSKFYPDILTDVLEWEYIQTFPPGYFETIAASPPCT
jgi:hypothetical protein